ncbi:hypothetical protein ARSEF4850_009834 [Beauveria asiatica]
MLIVDIQSTLLVLIKLGVELKARLDALNQAAEDLQLLTTNLRLLLVVFENPANESILKEHVSEFVAILDILQSIAKSCAKSGKLLDMDPSGQAAVDGSQDAFGRKLIRRIWIVKRIPGLLAEIQRKAEQLQKIYSAVSVVILQDIRANQERPPRGTDSSANSTLVAQDYNQVNGLDFSTNFASIDIILGNLMNECKSLRQQLEDNIIHPDTSAIENYEATNPEGMAFWKNKFQKELSTSSFRYEFKACFGGGYNITAGAGSNTYAFSTTPIKASFDGMLQSGVHSDAPTPQLEFILLGPSKVFYQAPKIGEKIQVEYDGIWHDSRVTLVAEDEIEFVDWDEIAPQAEPDTPIDDGSSDSSDDYGGYFFSEDVLKNLGKGTRRLWRPWKRDITKYDVRPFRCLHIGDSIDAPVMYPDFRFHYHTAENSQLYLPARIVDVQGDQYVVEFSPAVSAYAWWPGRLEKGTAIELIPGSGVYAGNPYQVNRATLAMNLVRPLSTGPRPVLGMQSGKPPSWSSFQGVQLGNLEELLEESLWNDGGR